MHVQDYLRSGKSPEDLKSELGIEYIHHEKYPNLITFQYSQINSPKKDPIVRECRSLVLDSNDNWSVVSRSFDRFFNYGEDLDLNLDFSSTVVQPKIDGSLMTLYSYNGEWQVASKKLPDARGLVSDNDFSFRELFWRVFNNLNYNLPPIDCKYCFSFELQTIFNQLVVQVKEDNLVLICTRNLQANDGIEEDPKEVIRKFGLNWNVIDSKPLTSIDEIIKSVDKFNCLENEGVVLRDEQFKRLKIKNKTYVSLSLIGQKIQDSQSDAAFIEIVRNGECDEIAAVFPKFKDRIYDLKVKYDNLVKLFEIKWDQYKDIEHQKDFAQSVSKLPFKGSPLFALRSRKTESIKDFLKNMSIKTLNSFFSNDY